MDDEQRLSEYLENEIDQQKIEQRTCSECEGEKRELTVYDSSRESQWICLTCEPHYDKPCRKCGTKRISCCC